MIIYRHEMLARTTATNPLHMSNNNVIDGGQRDEIRGEGEAEVEGKHQTSKTSLCL